VIAGLTYNFLPFMILPIYASLERIDTSLIEAGKDLYASSTQTFLRVTLPITMPGIVAGVLLTFIPAVGDYINAEILGGTGTSMIGNVIQSLYLEQRNYPEAAALSFLMAAIRRRLSTTDGRDRRSATRTRGWRPPPTGARPGLSFPAWAWLSQRL
jgi:spermidine/putrescine transport system permease protein